MEDDVRQNVPSLLHFKVYEFKVLSERSCPCYVPDCHVN